MIKVNGKIFSPANYNEFHSESLNFLKMAFKEIKETGLAVL
jgi:hypothetical protein